MEQNIAELIKTIRSCFNFNIIKYKTLNNIKNYILEKKFNALDKIQIQVKPQNNICIPNIDTILNNNLSYFYTTLLEKIPYVNIELLNNNIKTLTITEVKKFINKFIIGYYRTTTNSIKILKSSRKSFLFHEILHMSSSYYDKQNNIIYSGLSQTKDSKNIGIGLNEGYTEIICSRLFNTDNKVYYLEKNICKMLEKLVDSKTLERCYFNADLLSIIVELSKYDIRENIILMIQKIDYINELNRNKDNILNIELINETLNDIYSTIINCYIRKSTIYNIPKDTINKDLSELNKMCILKTQNKKRL